jgi:hypothetical protein
MGANKDWYKKWEVDHAARVFTHAGGLSLKLEPESAPLAWRFVLVKGIPAGTVLVPSTIYRLCHEALRLLQAQAWGGRFISGAVLPHREATMNARDLAAHNKLDPHELTQRHVDALLAQWQQARSGS